MPIKSMKPLPSIRVTNRRSIYRQLVKRFRNRTSIIAEGDSWFAYPPEFIFAGRSSNVIAHLAKMERYNLCTVAKSGDEILDILAGKKWNDLRSFVARDQPDILLISGGGNDVAGPDKVPAGAHGDLERNAFGYFLNDNVTSDDPKKYLNWTRLNRRLAAIEGVYDRLIAFVDVQAPLTRVVAHTYAYAIPNPKGAVFVGGLVKIKKGDSWLWPSLRAHDVPKKHDRAIVRLVMDAMAERLLKLEREWPGRFYVADTRKLVGPSQWKDEIHPDTHGFKKVAACMRARINDALG
ncbi:MAG: hypothetical protein ACI8TX_000090 [Hyphomicrobiaceae bacterium]|jgi:hypothetical protein